MRNEKNLANASSENLKNKTLHKGRKIIYPDIEIQLVQFIGSRSDLDLIQGSKFTSITQFIEFNRKLIKLISTWKLLLKLFEIAPEKKRKIDKNKQTIII